MPEAQHVELRWRDRAVRIEYRWIAEHDATLPLVVFLHEGLGSQSLWKDFPDRLCAAAGCRGLAYSRPGYGRSTPRGAEDAWGADFLHRQAHEVLPALLAALGVDAVREPPWLFGHSDGATIALLVAAAQPQAVAGVVVLAPHTHVEAIALQSIAQARDAYLRDDLREKLARHHDEPDSAFWGWNDVWLSADFEHWTIEREIEAIRCPLLAIQGIDDEYGTLAQIHGIARRLPQTELLELADCGHSAHRDQPEAVIAATVDFLQRQRR